MLVMICRGFGWYDLCGIGFLIALGMNSSGLVPTFVYMLRYVITCVLFCGSFCCQSRPWDDKIGGHLALPFPHYPVSFNSAQAWRA